MTKKIPSFKSLYKKLRDSTKDFTEQDLLYYAMYINSCDDVGQTIEAFNAAVVLEQNRIYKLHNLVKHKLLFVSAVLNSELDNRFGLTNMCKFPINWEE